MWNSRSRFPDMRGIKSVSVGANCPIRNAALNSIRRIRIERYGRSELLLLF
jgi:hypothetical protein